MATKKKIRSSRTKRGSDSDISFDEKKQTSSMRDETLRGIGGVLLLVGAVIFLLAAFGAAGKVGGVLYSIFSSLFGVGYYLVPFSFIMWAIALFRSLEKQVGMWQSIGAFIFFVSSLALLETTWGGSGGIIGGIIAHPLVNWLAVPATVVILLALIVIAILVIFDTHPHMPAFLSRKKEGDPLSADALLPLTPLGEKPMKIEAPLAGPVEAEAPEQGADAQKKRGLFTISDGTKRGDDIANLEVRSVRAGTYTPPPVSILRKHSGKPGVGDVKANANIIKRTLLNFGINVEMDEVSIGPTVTRYSLKPAEGVRLAKIVALQSNLELALAASPVRIEAPIPGKALVGIEVPNTARTTLGLGSLFTLPEFAGFYYRV